MSFTKLQGKKDGATSFDKCDRIMLKSISKVTVLVLLSTAAIILLDVRFKVGVTTWAESWTYVKDLQSVFQLGAALSITFAFAGPRISNFISGQEEELQRDQMILSSAGIDKYYVLGRQKLLYDAASILTYYERRWLAAAPARAFSYIVYTSACMFLLLFSCFSSYIWQNKNLVIACLVALLPPMLDLYLLRQISQPINNTVEAIRKFAMDDLYRGSFNQESGVKALNALKKLDEEFPKFQKN